VRSGVDGVAALNAEVVERECGEVRDVQSAQRVRRRRERLRNADPHEIVFQMHDTMVPAFLYGTAWKEDDTERLTRLAIENGFRGIDTANQRKHYHEAAVGAGIAGAIADGVVRREELFLQTKFTYRDGQDHRLPYDPDADVAAQVRQSFASSLEHLQVETLDSYVLHGPSRRRGLAAADREAWRTMEELHAAGKTRFLGISNVALDQLEMLCAEAAVKPAFVQNRCFARTRWDAEVRAFCRSNGIIYQGFSLLTANANELRNARFRAIVARTGATAAQVVFRFALQVGMLPLTGTTDARHMREDLAAAGIELSAEDVAAIETVAAG
jgi:diketogulonate reductase-like aldo/keto reductase